MKLEVPLVTSWVEMKDHFTGNRKNDDPCYKGANELASCISASIVVRIFIQGDC